MQAGTSIRVRSLILISRPFVDYRPHLLRSSEPIRTPPKSSQLFILNALILPAAFAEPALRTDTEGLMGRGDTVEFTVLDLNERFAALRQIYTVNDEALKSSLRRWPVSALITDVPGIP